MIFFKKPVVTHEFGLNLKTNSTENATVELVEIVKCDGKAQESLIKEMSVGEFEQLYRMVNNVHDLLDLHDAQHPQPLPVPHCNPPDIHCQTVPFVPEACRGESA